MSTRCADDDGVVHGFDVASDRVTWCARERRKRVVLLDVHGRNTNGNVLMLVMSGVDAETPITCLECLAGGRA